MRKLLLFFLVSCQSAPDETRRIADAARADRGAHAKLVELCDDVGNRLSGSPSLDRAIEWAVETMKKDGHENVRAEKCMVPKWVRGKESATIVEPREIPLAMLGIGGSVGGDVEAEVLVVADEKELDDRAKGKIVLFNNLYEGYGKSVRFRTGGAALAEAKGAVAILVRSVASLSLRSPHTGMQRPGPKIPAACISTEDADLIARFAARGKKVVVRLTMEAKDHGMVESANVIGEIRGREKPDEIVVIGGHLDSWDVGQGAHDDGAGCVAAMEALTTIRRLGLRPRRTIRVVLWVNEENGLAGAKAYAEAHKDEVHVAGIESDSGGFRPTGFSLEFDNEKALARLREIVRPLGLKADPGGSGADLSPLKDRKFPLLGLNVDGTKYFHYHHSHADTVDKVDPAELAECVAAMAAVAWALAEGPRLDE